MTCLTDGGPFQGSWTKNRAPPPQPTLCQTVNNCSNLLFHVLTFNLFKIYLIFHASIWSLDLLGVISKRFGLEVQSMSCPIPFKVEVTKVGKQSESLNTNDAVEIATCITGDSQAI